MKSNACLKDKIKHGRQEHKDVGKKQKTVALEEINSIEKRIDEGPAIAFPDNQHRLILLKKLKRSDKFASIATIQKAHVK
ncbi:hypothetical protein Tco_0551076 [Tanacetum coccineum]